MDFKKGDFILDKEGKVGEVVDVNEQEKLEVYFIVPFEGEANGKIFRYAEEWEEVDKEYVKEHIERPMRHEHVKTLIKLGYRPMGEHKGEEIFIPSDVDIEDDDDLKAFQFPTDGFDSDSDDETDSLDGFIVPDREGSPFRPASPTNEFVRFTHEAVHGYNDWVPDENDKFQVGLKRKIDSMELKYSAMEDDRQFALGKSCDYNHPPLRKKKSTTD